MAGNVVRMSQPGTPAATQPNYMKVFVQRDYSEGTSVKFQTRFPPELESRVRRLKSRLGFSVFTYWFLMLPGKKMFNLIKNKFNFELLFDNFRLIDTLSRAPWTNWTSILSKLRKDLAARTARVVWPASQRIWSTSVRRHIMRRYVNGGAQRFSAICKFKTGFWP